MTWWRSLVAVAVGGLLGCLLRWALAMLLNRYLPTVPPGTLVANLIGCYIIGVALAFFTQYPASRAKRYLLKVSRTRTLDCAGFATLPRPT